MLSNPVGWDNILGDKNTKYARFYRISEFFKQTGRWKNWLSILNKAESFIENENEILTEILRNKLWLFFWTRKYKEAKELINKYPHIDDMGDKNSYRERLKYMETTNLLKFAKEFENRDELDHFAESILGRAYAGLAVKRKGPTRIDYFKKAKNHLIKALDLAKKSYDLIEISVQSWYLACVLSDLGDVKEANKYLAESKRLDESIMERVPGMSWIKVAEYRVAVNDSSTSKETKELLRNRAVKAMADLGMKDAEQFVESDYYY